METCPPWIKKVVWAQHSDFSCNTEKTDIFIQISALCSPISLSLSTSIFIYFLEQSTPLPFFGFFFHWFFPCPFTILLKWNMNLAMFKIELDLESDDIWTGLKLDKINSSFSRLGKDIDLFREVWGLIYDFKQNRMCLPEFCAVFGILSHCRRILYPTTQWGPVLRALIQSSYFTWDIF